MPAESLLERSASGASAFATRIAFCEYVTDLPTLPGLGSSTYVLAKSSSAGKLLGLAAKVFSPKEISRDVSLSSESDTIAYEVTCSSKRELGKAGVKRSIYYLRHEDVEVMRSADERLVAVIERLLQIACALVVLRELPISICNRSRIRRKLLHELFIHGRFLLGILFF